MLSYQSLMLLCDLVNNFIPDIHLIHSDSLTHDLCRFFISNLSPHHAISIHVISYKPPLVFFIDKSNLFFPIRCTRPFWHHNVECNLQGQIQIHFSIMWVRPCMVNAINKYISITQQKSITEC